ncbi:MAG: hypothetical protein H6657_22605 [Ardenticatenaceae bacterium]|nr:hypothetical protein [Ardenticatenaceae bacterium]
MDKACYQIRVKSHLGPSSTHAFEGFAIQYEDNGDTLLTGLVADQAALHGILMKIRDLGLTLVELKSLTSNFKS